MVSSDTWNTPATAEHDSPVCIQPMAYSFRFVGTGHVYGLRDRVVTTDILAEILYFDSRHVHVSRWVVASVWAVI